MLCLGYHHTVPSSLDLDPVETRPDLKIVKPLSTDTQQIDVNHKTQNLRVVLEVRQWCEALVCRK